MYMFTALNAYSIAYSMFKYTMYIIHVRVPVLSIVPYCLQMYYTASLTGCDGVGHITGLYAMHFAQSGCPMAHGKTPEECRSRRVALNRLRQKSLPADTEDSPPKPIRKTPRTSQTSSSVAAAAATETVPEKMVLKLTPPLHIINVTISTFQQTPPAPKLPAPTPAPQIPQPATPSHVPPSNPQPPSSIGPPQLARIHQLYDMILPRRGGALSQEVDLEGHAPTTDLNLFKEARSATQEMLVHVYTCSTVIM